MIIGIGVDIVEIGRIGEAVRRWGDRFLRKIFTEEEIRYCYSKRDPFPSLAARFAAKEAGVKALSSLLPEGAHLSLRDMEVIRAASGRPSLSVISGPLSDLLSGEEFSLHLSLSHERGNAVAMAVLERKKG